MRYILNSEGYIFDISFGADISCSLGNCTEYTGEIPAGYSSLEEWHDAEIDRLNAWKIINCNLIYDSNKASELEAICNEQAENNRCVTKKELDTALADIGTGGEVVASNSNDIKMMLPTQTITGEIVTTVDSSSYEVKRIEITSDSDIKDKITLISSTPNLLPNEAVTQTIGGLTFTVNEDKSISLSGNATDSGTLIIAGSIAETTPILAFKKNQPYYITVLPSGLTWNMYCYENGSRELVYTGGGGIVELTENKAITYVEIVWASADIITLENDEPLLTEAGEEISTEGGTVASNTTIYPMLNVGDTALGYKVHEENKTIIDLGTKTLTSSGNIIIEDGECSLGTLDRVINTYNPNSVIYAIEDVSLIVDYYKSDLYEKMTATGTLHLTNTYVSTGAINKLVINDITAGSKYYLVAGQTELGVTNQYIIDLTSLTGLVDVVIEKGKVTVFKNDLPLKVLDDIYVNTYANDTYLRIANETDLVLDCEYMLKSTFTDIFCTIVEKNASFKILQDMIQLEVSRASEKEGELSSSITLEADKITQIVTAIGDENNEITPASIVQSINDDTSSIQIKADKVDITGAEFPSIQNESGTCSISTEGYRAGTDIVEYKAGMHVFSGGAIAIEDGNYIQTNGMVWADEGARLGTNTSDEVLLDVGFIDQDTVDVNGNLNVTNDLVVDGVVKLGKITNSRAKIMIDENGDIRIYGDLYVSGTIHGAIE